MKYPLTFYTDKFIKPWQAGCVKALCILIKPEYSNDEGLYQHELTHIHQWISLSLLPFLIGVTIGYVYEEYLYFITGFFIGISLHPLFYKFITSYRMYTELEAYKVQMLYPDKSGNRLSSENAAYRLSLQQYDLGITFEQAKLKFNEGKYEQNW